MEAREEQGRRIIDTLAPRRIARAHHVAIQIVVDIEEDGWVIEQRPQPILQLLRPQYLDIQRHVREAEKSVQQQLDAEGEGENPL